MGVPNLVGLIGRKQVGKDSVYGFLREHFGYSRAAFADPLKDVALFTNPWIIAEEDSGMRAWRLRDVVDHQGWEMAKQIPEVRRILQELGLGVRLKVAEDTWIRATLDNALAQGGPVVVTDVRFPNEADEILRAGGILVRVSRPYFESDDGHASESGLPERVVSAHLINMGSLEDLESQVLRVFNSLGDGAHTP
jgi:hypothetical protein